MNKDFTKQPLPAAIYSRVSSEEQKKGETINAHIAELKTFLEQEGNYLWDKEHGVYKDEAYSGAIIARPELDRLRDDAKAGRFQVVYFLQPDRLARDNHYIGLVCTELKRYGIKITFKNTPVADDPQGDLMLNIYGSFAQYERALISDRMRRGRRFKAEVRKLIVGSNAPYGYRYVKKNADKKLEGYYELIPEEIAVVKNIFDLVDTQNFTARKVTRWLAENNIPPRNINTTKWSLTTVLKILHRTEYIGVSYYNKSECVEPRQRNSSQRYKKRLKSSARFRPKEEWIAISVPHCKVIPEDQFTRVQIKLKNHKSFSKRNTKNQYLLSQLLRCNRCKYFWRCTSYSGVLYYLCSNPQQTFPLPRTCNAKSIRADMLDKTVWRAFSEIVKDPAIIVRQMQNLEKNYRTHSPVMADVKLEEKCIANLEKAQKRIIDAYKAEVIDIRTLQTEIHTIKNSTEKHKQTLANLRLRKHELVPPQFFKRNVTSYCDYVTKRLGDVEKDFYAKQDLMRHFIVEGLVDGSKVIFKCRIPFKGTVSGQNTNSSAPRRIPSPYPYSPALLNTTLGRDNHNFVNTASDFHDHKNTFPEIILKIVVHMKSAKYNFTT